MTADWQTAFRFRSKGPSANAYDHCAVENAS